MGEGRSRELTGIEFRAVKDDPAYRVWLRSNPGGFVLNAGPDNEIGARARLHRADCRHVGGAGNEPTNGELWVAPWNPKLVFPTWSDVEKFHRQRFNGVLRRPCGVCKPHEP